MQAFVLGVRQIRGEMNIKPSKLHPACCCRNASEQDQALRQRHRAYLERLAGLESVTVLAAGATAPESATALVGELIDPGADGRADRCGRGGGAPRQTDREDAAGPEQDAQKLANENFVRNAPPECRGDRARARRRTGAHCDQPHGATGACAAINEAMKQPRRD